MNTGTLTTSLMIAAICMVAAFGGMRLLALGSAAFTRGASTGKWSPAVAVLPLHLPVAGGGLIFALTRWPDVPVLVGSFAGFAVGLAAFARRPLGVA